MSWIWQHSPFREGSLLVHLALGDFADDEGVCWPAVKKLSEKARLGERQTQIVLHKLMEQGYLIIEFRGGKHKPNIYRLISKGAENAPLSAQRVHSSAPQRVHSSAPQPSLRTINLKKEQPAEPVLVDKSKLIKGKESWRPFADKIFNYDKKRFVRLIQFITWCYKQEYSERTITRALGRFWEVIQKKELEGPWWPYLTTLAKNLYIEDKQSESKRMTEEEKLFVQRAIKGISRKMGEPYEAKK